MNEIPIVGDFHREIAVAALADVFDRRESNVRIYCRNYPSLFAKAKGSELWDSGGRRFIDFLSGAGALNYGHNNPALKQALLEYLSSDGPVHSLDMHTEAKARFLINFERLILEPRGLDYKVLFVGPTGTNAVEAALKLARKVTRRRNVAAFTNAYHGVSLGALASTANASKRLGAQVSLNDVTRFPYEGFLGDQIDSVQILEDLLTRPGNAVDPLAAVIFETIQAEGGLNTCTGDWARAVSRLARQEGALLIVDDIQAGCGRTSSFFSFEDLGILPDIVCLSKSISGYGLPMSIVLLKREHDLWLPGEHNGTFRGNNLAFVTGAAALEIYWNGEGLSPSIARKSVHVFQKLNDLVHALPERFLTTKGRGLLAGVECREPEFAAQLVRKCYEHGLIIESCGPTDTVIKFLPALSIESAPLEEGLAIFEQAVKICHTEPDG
jgi:diaminobutyrate-2-oxoglutarate transaminase